MSPSLDQVLDPESLRFDDRGLIPVVAQDVGSGAVLMVAWADREAIERTRDTRQAHFWSRSRKSLWLKGETSGNVLDVVEARADCDRDTILLRVEARGPACHRGTRTCFEPNPAVAELGWLWQVLDDRRGAPPESSYTARLLAKGLPRIAQKVGEEGVETVIAALEGARLAETAEPGDPEPTRELVAEASDLLYHLLVLLMASGVEPARIVSELRSRHASRQVVPSPQAPDATNPVPASPRGSQSEPPK